MIELIESEIMDNGSAVHWNEIAGLEFVKTTVKEIVVFPLLRPDIFHGLRAPPKASRNFTSVLLYLLSIYVLLNTSRLVSYFPKFNSIDLNSSHILTMLFRAVMCIPYMGVITRIIR